jgi:hypothetical protein
VYNLEIEIEIDNDKLIHYYFLCLDAPPNYNEAAAVTNPEEGDKYQRFKWTYECSMEQKT